LPSGVVERHKLGTWIKDVVVVALVHDMSAPKDPIHWHKDIDAN
jgi:hypothetical protein